MSPRSLGRPPDPKNLEDAFFAKQDAELLEKLRKEAHLQARRAALREAAPKADDVVIDRLMELGIGPETVLAVTLVPLVVVAWADGAIDPKERAVLIRSAEERGIKPGNPAHEMFVRWLEREPRPQLIEAWKQFVRALGAALEEPERLAMHARLMEMARGVAEATGGFLGLTSKISPAEHAALEDLEAALR
jgi:hypothetical protein